MKSKPNSESKDKQSVDVSPREEERIVNLLSQKINSSCSHRYSIIGDYLTRETGFFLKKKIQWRVIVSRCVDCGYITKDRVYLAEEHIKIHRWKND